MKLENLQQFRLLYQTRNLAAVAEQLGVAASSVSRSLAKLEADLGVTLFQRTTRKVIPTEAADVFFQSIDMPLSEIETAISSLHRASNEPSGLLRISASVSYGNRVLVPLLSEFRKQHPAIQLELVLADTRIDIIQDRIDVALRHGMLEDSSLIARKLHAVKYCLVASESYLGCQPQIKKPDDLVEHSLIAFPYGEFARAWEFQLLARSAKKQKVAIKPALTISNAEAISKCTVDGLGVSLLADWLVKDDLQSCKLKSVLPNWQVSANQFDDAVWLVYPSKDYVPQKVKVFLEFLIARLNRAKSN